LLRKGRIDEVWFSDIPNFDERKEIYSIHLSRNGRDVSKFDLDVLGRYEFEDDAEAKTYPPTGAEIEYAIGDAIQDKFAMAKKKSKKLVIGGEDDIITEDILSKLKLIKPISFVAKDTIRKMRTWCKVNARSVSGAYGSEVKEKTKKTKIDLRSTDISL
jgi:SpoVK/Ycf46/Vps4 family AAA+-type ATPase